MLLFFLTLVFFYDEFRLFLKGLLQYGKGDWRNISRHFVITKTPTQVASHAQKYFIRQLSGGKDKKRPSIHDITTVNLADTNLPDNQKPCSVDQSNVLPQQQKSSSLPKVGLEWNDSNNGVVIFNPSNGNNLFVPSANDIGSNGLKLQGNNLYGTAYHGVHFKPPKFSVLNPI